MQPKPTLKNLRKVMLTISILIQYNNEVVNNQQP